jgi:hypothetical protein
MGSPFHGEAAISPTIFYTAVCVRGNGSMSDLGSEPKNLEPPAVSATVVKPDFFMRGPQPPLVTLNGHSVGIWLSLREGKRPLP